LCLERVSSKIGSGYFRDRFAKKLGNVAAKRVSDQVVAEKAAPKIIDAMPVRLAEMGIVTEVNQSYLKDSLIVLKL
jgi:hypothetical protein